MILVDANIPMYLVGAGHPNKFRAAAAVERAVGDGARLVTDVEVLQEILHRFTAIERPEAIQPAFDILLAVVEETLPIDVVDVHAAKDVLAGCSSSGDGPTVYSTPCSGAPTCVPPRCRPPPRCAACCPTRRST